MSERIILNYPCFDGKKVIENAKVTIENGKIVSIDDTEAADGDYFLMPGFIDAHTHMSTEEQIGRMLKSGVVATCDVSENASLTENPKRFTIVSSAGMTMGTFNGRGYVKKAIENGARYIKVLLFEPNLMPKCVLKEICKAAHESSLKVAVHATSVKAEKMALECGADILLHVPMKEKLPEELAQSIAEKGVVTVPTLVMMETFANSGKNGYRPEHYQNAEDAVRLLHRCGATILAGTDANMGYLAPAVAYGTSMHRETELLTGAGLTPAEALASATSKVAEVFGIDGLGTVEKGKKATLLLIEGRPDKNIANTAKIRQIWIEGKAIL